MESIYNKYRPIYTESVATAYGLRPKWNQRESAYVSRQRTWRTLLEPSSHTSRDPYTGGRVEQETLFKDPIGRH